MEKYETNNLASAKTIISQLEYAEEVENHLVMMLDALLHVSKDYLWYIDYSENLENTQYAEQLERVFAYEFYHQWRKILEKTDLCVFLNGEISKRVKDDLVRKKGTTLFPDIVLHGGQDNDNNQLIVCEIKRKEGITKDSFKLDLQNLTKYLSNEFFTRNPFKCGVFILVGDTMDKLRSEEYKEAVKSIDGIDMFSNFIVCITYNICTMEDTNKEVQSLNIELLSNILKN